MRLLSQGYPSTRLTQIATLAGLPAPTIDGAESQKVAASTPFGKALDLVPIVEVTEGGILWCDGAGTGSLRGIPNSGSEVGYVNDLRHNHRWSLRYDNWS